MSRAGAPRRVIGLGNRWRGDDGAGPACIAALRGRVGADVELIESDGEPAGLLALLAGSTEACLIDACVAGSAPGTVHRLDLARTTLPVPNGTASSHGLGLEVTLALARALGSLPAHCLVYAIEAGTCAAGAPLSAPVRRAVADVAEEIRRRLNPRRPAGPAPDASPTACGAHSDRTPWSR